MYRVKFNKLNNKMNKEDKDKGIGNKETSNKESENKIAKHTHKF